MALTRLQEDLLQEFREERRMIVSQIELFDPLAASMRKPAAQRLASHGIVLFGEILCWLAMLGCVTLAVFLPKLYPFYLLYQLKAPEIMAKLGIQNIQLLQWGVYGLIAVTGLLFILLARTLRRIRLKNSVLFLAGSRIKTLVGQHLERKAAIDAIEQRHFLELPGEEHQDTTTVANPGY